MSWFSISCLSKVRNYRHKKIPVLVNWDHPVNPVVGIEHDHERQFHSSAADTGRVRSARTLPFPAIRGEGCLFVCNGAMAVSVVPRIVTLEGPKVFQPHWVKLLIY